MNRHDIPNQMMQLTEHFLALVYFRHIPLIQYLRPWIKIQKSGGWHHFYLDQHSNDTQYGLIA